MTSRRLLVLNGALLLWLLAVQLAYYRVHKPVEPGAAAGLAMTRELLARPWDAGALLQPLGDVMAVGMLLAAALLVGRVVLRTLLSPSDFDVHSMESAVVAIGIGLGGLSLAVLGLLMAGRFSAGVVLGLGAAIAAAALGNEFLGARAPRPQGRFGRADEASSPPGDAGTQRFPREERERTEPLSPLISRLLLAYIVLALTVALTRALAPPIGWDSLVYHLTGPRLWVEFGGMVGQVDLPHYYFPVLVETLYAVLLLLRSDTAAQALHPALAALTVAATGLTARRFLGPAYAFPTAALLLSGTSLVSLAGRAYVEWGLMLFVVLAVGMLGHWQAGREHGIRNPERGGRPSSQSTAWLILAGLFLGLALGVKYTAAAVAAGAALVVVREGWAAGRRGGLEGPRGSLTDVRGSALSPRRVAFGDGARSSGLDLVWLALPALLAAAPWYLRTWVLTGNPVYPFVFGGWNWDDWKADWFSRAGTGLMQEPWRILIAPWELTVLGSEGGAIYDGTIGPMFLTLLPLAAFLPRPPLVQTCLIMAGVSYGFWLLGASSSALLQQPRLLYPIFPLLAIAGAWALLGTRRWAMPSFRLLRLLSATLVLGLGLALTTLLAGFASDTPVAYLAGAESRDEYLSRHLGAHATVVRNLDTLAGVDAKVLFLWEPRTYLCPVRCQPDGLLFNWRDALHQQGDPKNISGAWREAGYTHVLMHGAGIRYFIELGNGEVDWSHVAALESMEQRYLEHIVGPSVAEAADGEGTAYSLYRLR